MYIPIATVSAVIHNHDDSVYKNRRSQAVTKYLLMFHYSSEGVFDVSWCADMYTVFNCSITSCLKLHLVRGRYAT